MKQKLLYILLFFSFSVFGQNQHGLKSSNKLHLPKKRTQLQDLLPLKNAMCTDTLRYTQSKEQILGSNTFYYFDLWKSDNEAITMTYPLTGASTTISQIEFYARRNTNSVANVVVQASIYSVNSSNVPTTLLGSGSINITSTIENYYYVSLTTPVTINSNFAIVIQPTNTNGIVDILVNNIQNNQSYDESLSYIKSGYYPNSLGNYVTVPALTTGDATNFSSGPYNFEPIVAPILSYNITSSAFAQPATICEGQQVQLSGTANPSGILNSRFFNYQTFRLHFGTATNDSTHVWDFDDNSSLSWIQSSTNHLYSNAGNYNATYYTLCGFWNSCLDFAISSILVNPNPVVTLNADNTTVCAGSSVVLDAGGATSYLWGNNIGSGNTATVSPNVNSTFQVIGTTNGCSDTATVGINVNPLNDANFSYPSSTLCPTSGNVTATYTNNGIFTFSPAGLSLTNATTGEIDPANSSNGIYTITHSTSGICPDTYTINLTITSNPTTNFSYSSSTFCTSNSNESPIYSNNASAGTFSSIPSGLSINPSTGQINFSSSQPGNYTVTNAIAATNGCSASSSNFAVSVNTTPIVNQISPIHVCNGATVNPINFSPSPSGANVSWLNNNSTIGLSQSGSGNIPSFVSVNTSSNNVTSNIYYYATLGLCSSSPSSLSITVSPTPVVLIDAISDLCSNGNNVTLNGSPVGGTFSGNGVSGNQFSPTVGAGNYSINYTVVSSANCTGNTNTNVVVHQAPNVTLDAFNNLCIEDGLYTLTGGLPLGGMYSGIGVNNGVFNPVTNGVGQFNVSYSFIDSNNCLGNSMQPITVETCALIDEIENVAVSIFPNPAQTNCSIITSNECEVSLYSSDGKLIQEKIHVKPNLSTEFDVESLARGIYHFHINSGDYLIIRKVILH